MYQNDLGMNNIFAFSFLRHIDLTEHTTIIHIELVYIYPVLLLMLIPSLASLLGINGRRYVQGDDFMLGHGPIKTVQVGLVYNISRTETRRALTG